MFKGRFAVAACGALAVLLTAAAACPAQVVFFPAGRGGTGAVFGPRGGFVFPGGVGPVGYGGMGYGYSGYNPTIYPGFNNYNGFYGQPGYSSGYSAVYTTTPIYYGAASLGYSGAYSTARIVSPSPDVAYRATTGVREAAYTGPAYPVQSPNYTSVYPISPPLSVVAAMTEKTAGAARVEVHVPEDAEIWFEGQKTSQGGTDRFYTSPTLEAGQSYVYEVRASWTLDGKRVDETRKVTVRAGDRVHVDFLR